MKKLAAIFGVVVAMILSGCAGRGGTVADPQKPWLDLAAQRWNDPTATSVRWTPADLDWKAGSGRSLNDVNEIAMELAYNTNWKTLVKFFEGVPPGRKDLREEIFAKEVQGGHFVGDNPVHAWAAKLSLMSKNGDLSGQIWLQASQRGWNEWGSEISRLEMSSGMNKNATFFHFKPVKQEMIGERGAWVVLWLAHQQSLGNRKAVDHLGEDWSSVGQAQEGGVRALDGVGCGHHSYIAWLTANLRNLNWDGIGRDGRGEMSTSHFRDVGGWSKSKCNALIENWPEYAQAQIDRFNSFPRRQRPR
jgi:hypothetical protein